jgi:hypothetical protein
MKWDEMRKSYPNQWVKFEILKSHTKDNILYIDDMEFIKKIKDDLEATNELRNSTGHQLVYHTSHPEAKTKLIKL